MASDRMTVGIVILRKPLASPWADEAWLPHAVLPAVPLIEEGSMIGEADGARHIMPARPSSTCTLARPDIIATT